MRSLRWWLVRTYSFLPCWWPSWDLLWWPRWGCLTLTCFFYPLTNHKLYLIKFNFKRAWIYCKQLWFWMNFINICCYILTKFQACSSLFLVEMLSPSSVLFLLNDSIFVIFLFISCKMVNLRADTEFWNNVLSHTQHESYENMFSNSPSCYNICRQNLQFYVFLDQLLYKHVIKDNYTAGTCHMCMFSSNSTPYWPKTHWATNVEPAILSVLNRMHNNSWKSLGFCWFS